MNISSRKSKATWKRKLLALAVASCFAGEMAHANPTGPSVVRGQATFATHGNRLIVTNSPGAIINWQSFSIPSQNITQFLQQSASSAVLNRVTGSTPSTILGQMQSNGRVFLINPNGITIGQGAVIDVAGFVASSLNLSDADFVAGRNRFTEAPGAGAVVNRGKIKTARGGMVYLVGQNIENHGVIRSPGGEIILAAGKTIELVDAGTPEIRVQISAPDNEALNLGQLLASGGRIGMYAGIVRHGGTANANTAVVGENGKIVFKAVKDVKLEPGSVTTASGPTAGSITIEAQTGTAVVAGTVEANATAGSGGTVEVTGPQDVVIEPTGRLSASGLEGGTIALNSGSGTVQVSGQLSADASAGRGGQVAIAAAAQATVTAGTRVTASGSQAGGTASLQGSKGVTLEAGSTVQASGATGGVVTVNSEQGFVEINGTIEARGNDADGGLIQVTALSDITLGDSSILSVGGRGGGETRIEAREGTTLASGVIDAFGREGPGGKVMLLGPRVGLVRNGYINASGRTGGGTVLMGGDFQGKTPGIQNAEQTYIGPDARISADAIKSGNGGKVIIWADDATWFFGTVSARGGEVVGDGGFVEVSGKDWLAFAGRVDTRAPHGRTGTLLLDPTDITISTDPTSGGTCDTLPGGCFDLDDSPAPDSANLNVSDLIAALADNNVTISTNSGGGGTGNINVNTSISYGTTTSLDFIADASITIDNEIVNSGSGAIGFNAGDSINVNANVTATGGTLSLTAGTAITRGDLANTLKSGGLLSLNAATGITATTDAAAVTFLNSTSGDVTIDSQRAAGVTIGGSNSSGAVTLESVDAIELESITADSLSVTAVGAVADASGANVTVTNNASFEGSSITLDATHSFGSLTFNSAGAVDITEADATVLSGTSTAQSLVLVSGGSLTNTPTASINVTGLADLTANGGASLVALGTGVGDTFNAGTLSLDGSTVQVTENSATDLYQVSAASLTLISGGPITDAAGANVAVTGATSLTAGANSITLDSATNDFGGAVTIVSASNVTLDDVSALLLAAVNSTGNAQFDAGGAVTFTGVADIDGTLTVNSMANGGTGAAITDTGAGQLLVGGTTSLTAGTGSITLNNAANNFSAAVTVVSANNVVLDDTNALLLAALNATGMATLNAGGAVTLTGVADIGGNLTVNSIVNGGTGAAITDTGAGQLLVGGATSLTAGTGSITLDNAANDFTGAVSIVSANNALLVDTNDLVMGPSAVSGNLTLDVGGAATQTGAITASGLELLGTGTYTLNNPSNNVATIAADGPGGVAFTDSDALTVGTVNGTTGITVVGGDLSLTTGGNLAINGAMNIDGSVQLTTSAGGDIAINSAITTTSGGDVTINNAGELSVNANINADGDVEQNGAGVIFLDADIITTDDIVQFAQQVTLVNGPRLIDTSGAPGTGAGGRIHFQNALDGNGKSLTLVTPGGTGDVLFDGNVFGLTTLTINNAADVTAGGSLSTSGAINITAQGLATFNGPVVSGGAVTLRVNDLDLIGTINAGANNVRITPATTTQAVTLGAAGSGLQISDAELDRITTSGLLTVGSTNHTGAIAVAGAIDPANATGGFSIVNQQGGIAVNAPIVYTTGTGNLTLRANGGGATTGAITGTGGGLVTATNLALHAASGIGTAANPLRVAGGGATTANNTTAGGVFLLFPTGNLNLAGLTNGGTGTVSLQTTNGSINVNGALNAGGAVELTANATSAAPRIIDINAPITANGKVILRAADDISIDAQLNSNGGDVYVVAGKAPGMNLPGITMANGSAVTPAGETIADTDGGITIRGKVIAGAGNILMNATESVVQPSGVGGSAGLQNTGTLTVRTYNDADGAGRIDLRNDNNPNGNSNGPVTLETRMAADATAPLASPGGFAASNMDYRSFTGVVISTVGTNADVVIIAATQDVDIVALNLQVKNLTLIANAGDVNFVTQVTNDQINQGNPGGSLTLLASGDVNVLRIPGTNGVTIGRVLPNPTLDPKTGLPDPASIEKFDHELRLVAQGDINVQGSIYVSGDLRLRANASAGEVGNPQLPPTYANNGGSVNITVPSTDPVVISAKNIIVGTKDAAGRPLPVHNLTLTGGNAVAGSGVRQSAYASIEASETLEIFLTGDMTLTGGVANATNPVAGTTIENSAAATVGGSRVTIRGIKDSDNPGLGIPTLNSSNINLVGGTASATNQGTAKSDASALILALQDAEINVGGDISINGGDATATGSNATAVAIAGTEIGTQITGNVNLATSSRSMFVNSGTDNSTDGGIADGFASLAASGAITIVVTGLEDDQGLILDGAAGSGLFDALGSTFVRVGGAGYPITVSGRIRILTPPEDPLGLRSDALVIAGAPLVDDSLLAAFLRATETAREESLEQDANLQSRDSKGQAGVCR